MKGDSYRFVIGHLKPDAVEVMDDGDCKVANALET
jgi:hypothetical protein